MADRRHNSPEWRSCPYRPLIWKDVPRLLAAFREQFDPIHRKLDQISKEIKAMGAREDANWDRLIADLNKIVVGWAAQAARIADLEAALAAADADKAAALEADSEADADKVAAADAVIAALVADPEIPVEEAPVEEAPVEEAPAEETPADPAPSTDDEVVAEVPVEGSQQ